MRLRVKNHQTFNKGFSRIFQQKQNQRVKKGKKKSMKGVQGSPEKEQSPGGNSLNGDHSEPKRLTKKKQENLQGCVKTKKVKGFCGF